MECHVKVFIQYMHPNAQEEEEQQQRLFQRNEFCTKHFTGARVLSTKAAAAT